MGRGSLWLLLQESALAAGDVRREYLDPCPDRGGCREVDEAAAVVGINVGVIGSGACR